MATMKDVESGMPQHRFSGDTNVGEDGELSIGDPDIWGNGVNNNFVQPAIGVQGQRIVLNAAARLASSGIKR
jgi:hypothetical protein